MHLHCTTIMFFVRLYHCSLCLDIPLAPLKVMENSHLSGTFSYTYTQTAPVTPKMLQFSPQWYLPLLRTRSGIRAEDNLLVELE